MHLGYDTFEFLSNFTRFQLSVPIFTSSQALVSPLELR